MRPGWHRVLAGGAARVGNTTPRYVLVCTCAGVACAPVTRVVLLPNYSVLGGFNPGVTVAVVSLAWPGAGDACAVPGGAVLAGISCDDMNVLLAAESRDNSAEIATIPIHPNATMPAAANTITGNSQLFRSCTLTLTSFRCAVRNSALGSPDSLWTTSLTQHPYHRKEV